MQCNAGYNRRVTAQRRYDLVVVIFSFLAATTLMIYRCVETDENAAVEGLLRAAIAASTTRLLVLLSGVSSLLYSILITMKTIKVSLTIPHQTGPTDVGCCRCMVLL